MIDYLEDLLEEKGAVELTGRPLLPVGRRKVPLWEEETPLRMGQRLEDGSPPEESEIREEKQWARDGSPSWTEAAVPPRSAGVRLLDGLRRAEFAAGAIRHQGNPVTVTLPEEGFPGKGLDLECIDRAVQRDARRYDGGFPLY